MQTINATHVAPIGYARPLSRISSRGCNAHGEYRLFCQSCAYVVTWELVELSGDIIALILDRDSGQVLEYVTTEDDAYSVNHLAHDGEVVLRDDMLGDARALTLAYEASIYADCFSVPLSKRWPSTSAAELPGDERL